MTFRIAVAVAVLLRAASAHAQHPEDVVRRFFAAEDEGRWLDAARMLDLSAFERIRKTAVEAARHRGDFVGPTVESLMRMDPDMPRTVAEYQVREWQRHMHDYDFLAQEFAHIASADTLAALPVDGAAARWLEAKGPAWRTELQWRDPRNRPRNDCPMSLSDSAIKALELRQARRPRAVILGATTDTGTVSYVVVDIMFPGVSRADSVLRQGPLARAIELRRSSGTWRIEPAPDLPSANGMGGVYTYAVTCGKGSIIEKPVAN
jgi:hypothetical protein